MKVKGPGKTQSTSGTKKKSKTSGTSGSFEDFITSGAKESSGAAATQSIARVDNLLAVQGAEDPTARAAKQRARQRATTILDDLDNIRMAMLGGKLTIGHMVNIADVVASHRDRIDDPAMTALLDEIDLRAQVELAKMQVALDKVDA